MRHGPDKRRAGLPCALCRLTLLQVLRLALCLGHSASLRRISRLARRSRSGFDVHSGLSRIAGHVLVERTSGGWDGTTKA